MNDEFLDGSGAAKRRWRDAAPEASGISPQYYWLGNGSNALEVAYGSAGRQLNATAVRSVWKQRHGKGAAPLLLVIAYSEKGRPRALVCGPAGEDPPVVELGHEHAERLAEAALAEPDRHSAIRRVAEALEGGSEEQPGLRNRGLLATHELLNGVPQRQDWEDATARSAPLLRERGQELVEKLGYEIEPRTRYSVLRSREGRAQAVAVFLEDTEQADQPAPR